MFVLEVEAENSASAEPKLAAALACRSLVLEPLRCRQNGAAAGGESTAGLRLEISCGVFHRLLLFQVALQRNVAVQVHLQVTCEIDFQIIISDLKKVMTIINYPLLQPPQKPNKKSPLNLCRKITLWQQWFPLSWERCQRPL